jgi:hypothetical protein
MAKKKIILELTELEMEALTDLIDTYSALSEGISDDGAAQRDLKKVDNMLKKNGFKRAYA